MKPWIGDIDIALCIVAPFAGAWIETADAILKSNYGQVAPFAGAWIETNG